MAYLDHGEPVFHADPPTGLPATVVLYWPVDDLGEVLVDELDRVEARRWLVDRASWESLERIRGYGLELGAIDLLLRPTPSGELSPMPVWHHLPRVVPFDVVAVADRGVRALLEICT